MKKTITILVLSFVCFSSIYCQDDYDVVDNIQWELMDGPTGFATGFAKSGNRLFAKPHFYSDDMGESWHVLPDFFNPNHIAATDETVLIHKIDEIEYIAAPGSNGSIANRGIYSSSDNGNSFNKSLVTYTSGGYRSNLVLSDFAIKNENTFCIAKYNYGQGFLGSLFHTSDGGMNWDSISIKMKGQVSAAQDTVIVVNINEYGNNSGKVGVHVFGNDNFLNPRIDTMPWDLVGFYHHGDRVLYVDGLYYVAKPGMLKIYNPKTEAFVEYPFDFNYTPQFEFIDGLFYFSNHKGVFSFDPKDPTIINTLYLSPSPGASTIPFGIFDNIWLVYADGDIQRSFDKGNIWERKSRGITNSFGTMELIGDRFCLDNEIYSSPAVDFWSSDNPPTGSKYDNGYAHKKIFSFGDTLVQFVGKIRRESIDGGITWDSLSFSQFGFESLFENRDSFVNFHDRNVRYSVDKGKTWTQHWQYLHALWIRAGSASPIVHGFVNDLLVLHSTQNVFVSRNYGKKWFRINDVPFGTHVGHEGTINTLFLRGAKRYFYKDNYLYAFQDGYGLWRTPMDELEKALRGIVDGSDLELTMKTKDPEPENWTNFSVEVTIENTGTLPNDNIIVHVPEPEEVVYQGRNEYQTTKGHFEFWQIQEWEVGSLEPGESATLTLNYFRINNEPFNCFAQVIEADELDLDSSPDNGSCCAVAEDDEAVIEFGEAPPSVWNRSAPYPNLQFDVVAFPNPFGNELNFRIQSKEEGSGQIQILDLLGRMIHYQPVKLISGENLISIETTDFPEGILTAKISNSENEFQRVQIFKNR